MANEIAIRENLPALVGTYKKAVEDIEQAYALLESAQGSLRSAFLESSIYCFNVNPREMSKVGKAASDVVVDKIKREAWSVIVERMSLRSILSIKQREKIDEQIRCGQLPDISEENILAMLQDSAANVNTFLEDAVKEVFEFLRPPRSRLKTNTEFEVGKKVILSYLVEKSIGRKFRVIYRSDQYVTALDNVFQLLDGKGPVKTYYGPLYNAIDASSDGRGQTEYFKFKCCLNGNLHLEFIRMDLVAKLNAVAGGTKLRSGAGRHEDKI